MSLRFRLTLWYSALLAGLLVTIAVMALSRVRAGVVGDTDLELRSRGENIVRLLQIGLPSGTLASTLLPAVSESFEPELYVQVRDLNRRVSYRSTNLANKLIPFPESFYQQALQGRGGFYSLSFNRPDDLRVYFTPILFGGEIIGTVQVGRNLASQQDILRELAGNLVGMILAALAVGAGVGYWLAGVALRPIQEATATALAITRTGRLDNRVPTPPVRTDEIGTLISTFNEMLDRLQELFEKQRRFSGDISHELRSPLTTVLGNLALLKRAGALPAAERAEMVAEIEVEALRMKRMISDLLLLSQADAELALARERLELDTLLLEVYRQARRRACDREMRLLHEDQAIVMGDAERLRQVLVNLIDNAIQYTPPGGRIDLGLECLGSQAMISVSDTGQGIAPADLPHIFDRFYRADKARSRAAGGAGLGLSIVKWIVEAHEGEIDVESTLGAGTTFRVFLPLTDLGCGNKPAPAMDAQAARFRGSALAAQET